MPLPDADPDKRMYKLLKNIDLENLTFEQFQSTAQTVFAEPESEDTLRRIVLINLSRMAVAGQWNGLTTSASGGGDFNAEVPGVSIGVASANSRHPVGSYAPYGEGDLTSFTWYSNDNSNKTVYYPFIAPKTGTVTEFGVQVTAVAASACNLLIGIYTDDGNGAPDTLQMSGEIDVENSGTGSIYQTSISADVSTSITRGTQYWAAMNRDTDSIAFTLKAYAGVGTPNVGALSSSSLAADESLILRTVDKPLALVATESLTNLGGANSGKCVLTLKVS